mgnify:FL=1
MLSRDINLMVEHVINLIYSKNEIHTARVLNFERNDLNKFTLRNLVIILFRDFKLKEKKFT